MKFKQTLAFATTICSFSAVQVLLTYVDCFNFRMTLIYANGRKLLDLNRLSPIGLLLGVSLTWSCYQKVVEQMEQQPMVETLQISREQRVEASVISGSNKK